MKKPKALKVGDKVAIVSLSSGMLGEEFCKHNVEIGSKRLKEMGVQPVFMPNARKGIEYLREHPEARAADLKAAFADESIKGIICGIGGDDTYRLLPYLMGDQRFLASVEAHPKLFTGFSDTTINHLMFYQLGLSTFYGPAFITDLAEISTTMLPYTERWFRCFFEGETVKEIDSSDYWYEERLDFSRKAIGQERIFHQEKRGFEVLQGEGYVTGSLLGGCLESLYDCLAGTRYADEVTICRKYRLFPETKQWQHKIFFLETSEEKPTPEKVERMLTALKEQGIFKEINGMIVGKPQDEVYYEEYKKILCEVVDDPTLPILYNVNFGHATPRCVLPYGMQVKLDLDQKKIEFLEPFFAK